MSMFKSITQSLFPTLYMSNKQLKRYKKALKKRTKAKNKQTLLDLKKELKELQEENARELAKNHTI